LHPEAPRSAVGSSALFRRKRRGKALDVVSAAIPGGVAAGNDGVKLPKTMRSTDLRTT